MKEKTYWDKLVKEQIKVSVGTKDKKFYSGYVKDLNEQGFFFLDKFDNEIFFSFDNINFIEPFKSNGKKAGEGSPRGEGEK